MADLTNDTVDIREVWDDNLEDEFTLISNTIDAYPYVAMDTEFPGFLHQPSGNFREGNFQSLKANVDVMKLIQLGLTLSDGEGNLPHCGTEKFVLWQFNFREFDPNEDVHAPASYQLLCRSGIDFKKFREKGVSAYHFSQLLMTSGIVLNDEVRWLTFHGMYDFGYLLKLLTWRNLPDTHAGFMQLINVYFPVVYDVKHLMNFCHGHHLYGGLNQVAGLLRITRVGNAHQAGSDSLLTSRVYFRLKLIFNGSPKGHAGVLFGL